MNKSKKLHQELERIGRDMIRLENEFAKMARNYCRAQKGLWWLIPALALEADGRGSFSDRYSRAYLFRQWPLDLRAGHLAVDLKTGEIINIFSPGHNLPPNPAEDGELLALAGNLSEIDAHSIIEALTESLKIPNGTAGPVAATAEQVKERRKNLRIKLGLSEIHSAK